MQNDRHRVAPIGGRREDIDLRERAQHDVQQVMNRSDGLDAAGLGAFLALGHFKLNALVLGQGTETLGVDLAEVREEVFATIVRLDETEALGFVEPLDDTGLGRHVDAVP
jgi:hypothetical protein